MSDGRSEWMIDCRKLNDPECDKDLRIHVGEKNEEHEVHHGIQGLP